MGEQLILLPMSDQSDHPLILLWHRRDLRLHDHLALAKARQKTARIVGVFCLDNKILQAKAMAPARVAYLLGCLQSLQDHYQRLGSQLLIFHADPVQLLPKLANTLGAQRVVWTLDTEPYAQQRDLAVAQALREQGLAIATEWDQLMHHPGEVLTQAGNPYTVYTPFWKNWRQLPKASPVSTPKDLQGLSAAEQEKLDPLGLQAIPQLTDLGFSWDQPLPLAPGEEAAEERLAWFVANVLEEYQQTRNFPALDGTSQLSAALKFGVISPRTLWQATVAAWDQSRSEEARASIETWQQELAWREFYQHCLYSFPALAQGPYRSPFQEFPWEENQDHFQAWCAGETGYPIIDAAMAQLNQTGWMHNRCRMIVASFLTKDLILNWQWGELYFMQTLYDGDLAANNGGWQWSASSGMDPKPLRIFNPYTQAQKFDPEGEYIRTWLPQLAPFDTGDLLTGKLSPIERRAVNYPDPVVDHNQQQREFKRRYQLVK
ncbi:FAD-binding domain-containing protein [Synechocystis salina]|uniref:Deoxyribodipyrimidine photo-lyase n=1 Tax=Synechocystis salina LEGE 00031 TaxID=1828736 RepID=A0ABR9VM29_9SYNC|nr:FAD-binding domain-containing protein [Synechocystis salina]MBE9239429.1 deoxyribodipyrimidine photo-lyase [Synechocystis salina LEGE 00041]MBE9252399.1 deoxyribodipyrimidine photo-lyase [Synechocystis salina LEGE 00031]